MNKKHIPKIQTEFVSNVVWQNNKSEYNIDSADVHVWKIEVPKHFSYLFKEHRTILNDEEFDRARRYHWEQGFKNYLTGRIALRILLGKYLKKAPSEIKFTSLFKKPAVESSSQLKFNLSYSGEYILISISLYETGVDIEKIKNEFDYEPLLASCFSTDEIEEVKRECERSRESFFLQWTRKESLLKYTGKGINDYLTSVPSLDGSHSVDSEETGITEDLKLTSFSLDRVCYASIVYPRQVSNIEYINWA